jgi:hypothetical protein
VCSGARRSWRRDDPNAASRPPQTGVKKMETKYVTFGGGQSASLVQWTDKAAQEISASLAKANISAGASSGGGQGDAMSGQHFSTSSPVATTTPLSVAASLPQKHVMVSFKGGGLPAAPPAEIAPVRAPKQSAPSRRVSTSCSVSVGGNADAISISSNGGAASSKEDIATPDIPPCEPEGATTTDGGDPKPFELSDDGGMMFSTS